MQIYNANNILTLKEKAQILLCLALVFVKYTSTRYFGVEDDSPLMLRYYAYALMKKVHELDSTIIGSNFQPWTNKLLGLEGAFQCTAVLYNSMKEHCELNFKEIVNIIIPSNIK